MMNKNIKQQLRSKYLQILKAIKPNDKKQWDQEIYQQFINSKYFTNNQVFALYYSLPYEVNTIKIITALLAAKKKVALPRINGNNLDFFYINHLSDLVIDNQWKIYQPLTTSHNVNINDLDVIILPLVAFNHDYYRIGHGKGYYDHFLSDHNLKALKLVLAYQVQEISEKIEFVNNWDIAFDVLITNH